MRFERRVGQAWLFGHGAPWAAGGLAALGLSVAILASLASLALLASPAAASSSAPLGASEPIDVVFVIDNSGSMKGYDPAFITRDAVRSFFTALPEASREHARLGMVIYDETARLVVPLSPMRDPNTSSAFEQSLEDIDFTGRWTNTPAGIERALYELEENGRKSAQKAILFLTDGRIDTGSPDRDRSGRKWLREELAEQSRNAGIRIYGIAFTDEADFELIQALALKTDGRYYRTYEAQSLPSTFGKLFARLDEERLVRVVAAHEAATQAEAEREAQAHETARAQAARREAQRAASPPRSPAPATPPQPAFVVEPLPLLLLAILLLAAIIAALVFARRSSKPATSSPVLEPGARLVSEREDVPDVEVARAHFSVGRDAQSDLVIAKQTISSLHATIEHRDGYFFLRDHRSKNGTQLNDKKLAPNNPIELKSGDRIQFASTEYTFLLPNRTPAGETVAVAEPRVAAGADRVAVAIPPAVNAPLSSPALAAITRSPQEDLEAFRSELRADIARIRALSASHDQFVRHHFTDAIKSRLGETVEDMIRPSLMMPEGKRAMFAEDGVLYVLCVLFADREHAPEWFTRKFGGFANLLTDCMQSSLFHEQDCKVLCVITFGQARDAWVSTTLSTSKDFPENIETLSKDLMSGVERRLLDLD